MSLVHVHRKLSPIRTNVENTRMGQLRKTKAISEIVAKNLVRLQDPFLTWRRQICQMLIHLGSVRSKYG